MPFNPLTDDLGTFSTLLNFMPNENITVGGNSFEGFMMQLSDKSDLGHTHLELTSFNQSVASVLISYFEANADFHASYDGSVLSTSTSGAELDLLRVEGEVDLGPWLLRKSANDLQMVLKQSYEPGALPASVTINTGGVPVGTFTANGFIWVPNDLTCRSVDGQIMAGDSLALGYQDQASRGNTGPSVAMNVSGNTLNINGASDFLGVEVIGTVNAAMFEVLSARDLKVDVDEGRRHEMAMAALSASTVEFNYLGDVTRRAGILADGADELVAGGGHDHMNVGALLACMAAAVLEVADAQDRRLHQLRTV